jgi:hypothetical protein
MKTKDSIRFYSATKYRSHCPDIDSIDWSVPCATYDEAFEKGNEYRTSEEGLSIYLVYEGTHIFSCWPYQVETGRNPCFVGSITCPDNNTWVTTQISFGAFFKNPEKYLRYAEAIKSPQEDAHE